MISYGRCRRHRPTARHKKLLTAVFDSDVKRFAGVKNTGANSRDAVQPLPKKRLCHTSVIASGEF
jgi:hypothetical protein